MAAALPVIASREGESAAFVNEAKCGILVDPSNTQEIADAIAWLLTHPAEAEAMGKRGQQLVFGKYNWENEKEVLLNLYEQVLG
jgi:glycosyltransferase involved in cell wall biosynthesis